MDNQKKIEIVSEAKGLSKWFAVDVVIKIFNFTIWEFHFPPKTTEHD